MMGNRIFKEARNSIEQLKNANSTDLQVSLEKAKNALSSAYANSTVAEQAQLSEMQKELEQYESK